MKFMKNLFTILIFSCFLIAFSSSQVFCGKLDTPQKDNLLIPKSTETLQRSELRVPDELWNQILDKVGYSGKTLGYTTDEMNYFTSYVHEFRLQKVWDLFRDVQGVADFGGDSGDYMLQNYMKPADMATYCFNLLALETETGGTRTEQYSNYMKNLNLLMPEEFVFDTPADKTRWNSLPKEVQDFITVIVTASSSSITFLNNAYDKTYIAQNLGVSVAQLDTINRQDLYDFAIAPWKAASPQSPSFDVMKDNHFHVDQLKNGTTTLLSGVNSALTTLITWLSSNQITGADFNTLKFSCSAGKVCILGTGDQQISGDYSIIIDLGGNDIYTGANAIPRSFSTPVGLIVDLSGNDIYDGGTGIANFCSGLFGIGAIFDISGNDSYISGEAGIASALHGTGFLMDFAGNDNYFSQASWSQAAAHAGVGLLVDAGGNDSYYAIDQSQGFGSTLGIGALVDVSGNDSYYAEGVYSGPFYYNTAFCQGAGFGRRADFGDGRSLAGGIGMLVEGAGDDTYYGPVYVQGCGYWWAAGFLEDRSGNDSYRCWQYSLGSAPHMAIGCMVDLTGDDRYNSDYGDSSTQYHACARDGCIAVFIDGEGNDHYFQKNRSASEAELCSLALFWDRTGDDIYDTSLSGRFPGNPPFSYCGYEGPYGNMRDQILMASIFLDSQGHDIYNIDPTDFGVPKPSCAENSEWVHNAGEEYKSIGIDTDWDFK
jgi:hypothetical protein